MIMIKNGTCLSNVNTNCRSLISSNHVFFKKNRKTRRKKGQIHVTCAGKIIIIIIAIENKMK